MMTRLCVGCVSVGKSTFLQLLTASLPPSGGSVVVGETVTFGYYMQMGLALTDKQKEMTVIRFMQVCVHACMIYR